MMLSTEPIRTLLLLTTVARSGLWLVCHHDVVNRVMMPRNHCDAALWFVGVVAPRRFQHQGDAEFHYAVAK